VATTLAARPRRTASRRNNGRSNNPLASRVGNSRRRNRHNDHRAGSRPSNNRHSAVSKAKRRGHRRLRAIVLARARRPVSAIAAAPSKASIAAAVRQRTQVNAVTLAGRVPAAVGHEVGEVGQGLAGAAGAADRFNYFELHVDP